MKLRIHDDSVRYRITLSELEKLEREGEIVGCANVPGVCGGVFVYSVRLEPGQGESAVILEESGISLRLCPVDFADLKNPANEGAYIRREWTDGQGETRRFMAFIEKDRPASKCDKPEAWIFEENWSGPSPVRPIPPPGGPD
ncbi:MAG: hypothetical protein K1X53_14695 [Candidatus Sumerlaeaceae bacterium]|nr:hypothetical protein [Candidatus Sumerlaeaceae bacterium]